MPKVVGKLKAVLGLDKSRYTKGMKQARKEGGKFGSYMKKLGGIVAGFFAFGKLIQGIKGLIQKNAEFGQSLADLSAITGAVGKDLDFYEQQARKIGATTTLAASQAVKAFELMGSARPELLKNKEALAAVTREAVILAEASGMDLPVATQALAKAMNQFNVPASEAGRVINVLAAGSKEGAEAIPGLAEAIKWMGTSADMANISLEESVGLIETLAEKGLAGAESGAQLRNVILKLQSGISKFNPKVVGMTQALKNLGAANLSAADLTLMFGLRNQQAAAILISNVDKFERYTEAVTGTNVAYEQQAKKVDTIKGKWKALLSVIESNVLQGTKFRDTIKDALEAATAQVPNLIGELRNLSNEVISVINYFIDLHNESIAFRWAVQGIGLTFKAVFGFIKVNIQSTIETFKVMGQIVKDIFTGNWDAIREHMDQSGQEIIDDWKEYTDKMAADWQNAMEKATSKTYMQHVKMVTAGGGGAAPEATPGTQPGAAVGSRLPSGIPDISINAQKAIPHIAAMNKAIEKSAKKMIQFANASATGQIAIDMFAGMSNSISDALSSTENTLDAFGKFFSDFIKGMIIKLTAATIAAFALAAVLSLIGGTAPTKILGLAKGAGFKGLFGGAFKGIMGLAGGNFTVPSGYPNDTFPAMLSSGETVLTPNQMNHMRGSSEISLKPIRIDIPGRSIRIVLGRENDYMNSVGT